MKQLLLILVLCLGADLCAQQLLGQEFWPDGTLRATRYAVGARVHFVTYHENGLVKEIGCFRNGRRDGEWKQYADNGTVLAQAAFRDGLRDGIWEFRSGAGLPIGSLSYRNGSLQHSSVYDNDGLIAASKYY